MTDRLPDGWAKTKLNDLLQFAIGGDWGFDPQSDSTGLVQAKVIRGTDFRNWQRDKGTSAAVRRIKPQSLKKRRLERGDLILEVSGGGPDQPVGRTVLIDQEALNRATAPLVCSNFFRLLRLVSEVDPLFISRFLEWAYQQGSFNQFQTQTTNLRNLNVTNFLEGIEVLIAPATEQRQIAEKLETLLAEVEHCKERMAKIPILLKHFRQSVLAAACSGRLTADWRNGSECNEWDEVRLADVVIEKPKNGYSAKPVKHKTAWRVLTLTATTSGRFDARYFKYFDRPVPKDSTLWLKPGDILVQRGNTIEYVGVPAIYDGPAAEFIYPDLMMRLRANDRIATKFLYYALSWERTRNLLRAGATGTAGNMPKINQGLLLSVPIPLPPLAEQQEIDRRVEELLGLADHIEDRYQGAKKQVDGLTQSILAKAFRGELVSTEAELAAREGRTYESAAQLVEKIHRSRKRD